MNSHDWFVEHRAEYAARILDPDAHDRFADHLGRCPECSAAVAGLERDLAWLPMGARPVTPPPGMTRRLTEGVLQRHRPGMRWLLPAGLAASLAITSLVAWEARGGEARLQAEVDRLLAEARAGDARLAATLDTLSVIRSARRVMPARLARVGADAGLVIFEDPDSHRWTVVVHGLPEAPAGERFALWFVCERGMREGTALPQTMNGAAVLIVPMPQDLGAVLAASITREVMPSETGGMPAKKLELLNLRL